MQKRISVQICSHNRKNLLEKVLLSLYDQTIARDAFEVIVVDDGSTDGTAEMMQNLKAPIDLVFIRQGKEGLAAGRNKGLLQAKGEIVLFIDDDVLADPKLLEEHLLFHEKHPRAIVKGWVNHVSVMERPQKPKWTLKDFSTAIFWTSNVSVEREFLLQAGLFDEDFKEYGWEDLELGLRLKRLGLKTLTNHNAIGYHYKRSMAAEDFPSMLKQAEAKGRTAVIFAKKHPAWRARLSTGIHPLRMAYDSLLSIPVLLRFYQRFVPENGHRLTFWSKFCIRSLVTARYFQAVRQSLNEAELTRDSTGFHPI